MIRRTSIAILVTACFMLAGFLLLAWRPSIAPIEPPSPSTFPAELVAKGEALSAVGHCAACHTQPGGQLFAGGYRINTPFGAIFGTNITPDRKTGIGIWSLNAFTRAMREGVARDGSHFPQERFLITPEWRQSWTNLNKCVSGSLLCQATTLNAVWHQGRSTPKRAIPLQLSVWGDGDGSP
jgi:hypothetical protein